MQQIARVQGLAASETATEPGSAARLSVSLVGRPSIMFCGRPIELRTQKASAVLSYLALTEAKHESRGRLVGLLWSRSDEEKARASLRQVVRELRSAFEDAGYGGFSAGRLSIHLNAEDVEVDVESIIRLAESGRVHPLLLNTPDLGQRILDGMDDLDPSFRIWVLAKRQTIHDRLMRSLGAGLVAKEIAADAKTEIAAAIANLDPTHEEACCHLMRVHAEEGDVAGALRIYKSLWDLLDRDYGMEPSPATEELVADIKLGAFERPAGRSGAQLELGSRMVRAGHGLPSRSFDPEARYSGAPARIRLVLRPFRDAWHRQRSCPPGAGIQPASCGVSGAFPRMERDRSSGCRGRASAAGFGAAILHRNDGVSGGRRNQHGDGAAGRSDRHLHLERKPSAQPRQLVRDAAAHHPPDRDLAERAAVGRTADAACGRTRRFARCSRPLASRAEIS